MIIKKNTEMLLFRFNNYRNHPFIKAHQEVLNEDGYVWMLKIGKRSSVAKIQAIIDCGGWLVLRSPKADDNDANNLVISKSDKKVNEVIGTTRTAVMFIKNSTDITV